MSYLLIATLVFYGLAYWAYRACDRPGDDFGAVMPFIFCLVVSIILTIIYVGLAFWRHSFL